jgi:hypothetical protein
MLYYSIMARHRTQLYLDEDQYRWLKRRANGNSIAGVVRELIDAEREREPEPSMEDDPFIQYLLYAPRIKTGRPSSVTTIDQELYG